MAPAMNATLTIRAAALKHTAFPSASVLPCRNRPSSWISMFPLTSAGSTASTPNSVMP